MSETVGDNNTASNDVQGHDGVPEHDEPAHDDAPELSRVDAESLPAALEALLMVADQPLSVLALAQVTGAPRGEVESVVESLRAEYAGELGGRARGFELRQVGGGWRIYASRAFDDLVRSMLHDDSPQRLSQQALETLAVIAYKQPVTRSQVSAVRAVNVDSVMRTLIARGLIDEHSTDSETGAIFYQTTPLLLEYLGIESLEQLPPLSPLLSDGREGFDHVDH